MVLTVQWIENLVLQNNIPIIPKQFADMDPTENVFILIDTLHFKSTRTIVIFGLIPILGDWVWVTGSGAKQFSSGEVLPTGCLRAILFPICEIFQMLGKHSPNSARFDGHNYHIKRYTVQTSFYNKSCQILTSNSRLSMEVSTGRLSGPGFEVSENRTVFWTSTKNNNAHDKYIELWFVLGWSYGIGRCVGQGTHSNSLMLRPTFVEYPAVKYPLDKILKLALWQGPN